MHEVIIDCGATSTKMATLSNGEVQYSSFEGFNPHHGEWTVFASTLKDKLGTLEPPPKSISFYGAGLSTPELIDRMTGLLCDLSKLPKDCISVHSDLMACAHASFSGHPVIVGILGTGSNVGCYDGHELTRQTPSLGYLLADEGSGVDIGKRLLLAHYYRQLPDEIDSYLDTHFNLRMEHVIDEIYGRNRLRDLVGQLAPVATHFINVPEISQLVRDSFKSFIQNRIEPEIRANPSTHEVHLYGTLAKTFESTIRNLMKDRYPHLSLMTHKGALQLIVRKRKEINKL